jgi:GGDEF domain-containing protein
LRARRNPWANEGLPFPEMMSGSKGDSGLAAFGANPFGQFPFPPGTEIIPHSPERKVFVDVLNKSAWKSLLLPHGLLLITVAVLLHAGWLTTVLPAVNFLNYAVLAVGLLLAWRFHSSRAVFALLALLLAQQAILYSSAGHIPLTGSGRAAFDAIALLLPLNFLLISLMSESGLSFSQVIPIGLMFFLQAASVAIFCRGTEATPAHAAHRAATSLPVPDYAWLAFAAAVTLLLIRFVWRRKPIDSGLLWSLAAFFVALHFGVVGRIATTYLAVSAFSLSLSVVETSYQLAYHDELTSLPSRRAFNDALANLQAPYSIAMVDIDHFKQCNDTYGHDTGDQVLQLVASRLAAVTGGGQAFRFGGEEFAVLFKNRTTGEIEDHLEWLRSRIEASSFLMRAGPDRRHSPRGPDRRNLKGRALNGRAMTGHVIRRLAKVPTAAQISVTVSIGAASAAEANAVPDAVLQAADKALYRAKSGGRNRVETESAPRRAIRARAAGIA